MATVALGRDPGAASTGPGARAAPDPAVVARLRPAIEPRASWGADLPVTGEIVAEEDVRFLLVHHTASTNDYGPDEVVDQIRGFHRFHTGPEKGWPDVAYNFFVDRFGGIWEARAGSLAGPVRGDATGGSQGFALLCSLIGDHSQVPVSTEAAASLIALLAWLGERHGITTEPGATIDFVSRGSNRWSAGTPVTAATISGHRDMSQTSCPGEFAYGLVRDELPREVTDLRLRVAAEMTAEAAAASTTSSVTSAPFEAATSATTTAAPATADEAAPILGAGAEPDEIGSTVATAVVGGVAALGAGAIVAAARRRGRRPDPEPG